MYNKMNAKREEWIDLDILVTSCKYTSQNKLYVYWQYSDKFPSPVDNNNHYLLRQALRAVGHKIEMILSYYGQNDKLVQLEFHTTVTRDEYEVAQMFRREYADDHEDEEFEGGCSDADSIPESSPPTLEDPCEPV